MNDQARKAYEATEYVLSDIENLVAALDVIEDDLPGDYSSDNRKALSGVIRVLRASFDQLHDLRRLEWLALGGNG